MNEQPFIFDSYDFDHQTHRATFRYVYDGYTYAEVVQFAPGNQQVAQPVLDRALFLAFMLTGTSYYKAFPTTVLQLKSGELDQWQGEMLRAIYTKGLSQFLYQNNMTANDIADFTQLVNIGAAAALPDYQGNGCLVLQSGGKDSLLVATRLEEKHHPFTPWYVTSRLDSHPAVLDTLATPLQLVHRQVDIDSLKKASMNGGRNGHVPVTLILLGYALIQAVLNGHDTVLYAVGNEAEEPHAHIGDLAVMHHWAKSWEAEQLISQWVQRYISPNLRIGSPLRGYSELAVAEMFVQHSWQRFAHQFSSCNRANYQQGHDNSTLRWCGECAKCANSFLLFAPFVPPSELAALFDGRNLFRQSMLVDIFKGLLDVDDVTKPFECVGSYDELRTAYHMAAQRWGSDTYQLPFAVPPATPGYDYHQIVSHQDWAADEVA